MAEYSKGKEKEKLNNNGGVAVVTPRIESLSITSSTTMEDLSKDLIENILFRLPIKSLLIFKSVSKKWCSLISPGSEFVKRHLKEGSIFFELDPLDKAILFHYSDLHTLKFDFPDKVPTPCRVFGSANGLICVAPLYGKGCLVWNPFIGDCKIISPTENFCGCRLSGFCYDSNSDDYKIVGVWTSRFRVFSLKNNSWTTEQEHNISFRNFTTTPIFSNGALHWCIGLKIVAFDPAKDHLFEMEIPKEKRPTSRFYVRCSKEMLFDYQGSLCFFDNIHLWEMKEYGVGDSWTELDTESVNLPAWISRVMERKSRTVKLVGFLHTESLTPPNYLLGANLNLIKDEQN